MSVPSRLEQRFQELKQTGRKGFAAFVTAGDPDLATSARILAGLPQAGVDIIELGMPFSDPMADGPAIQRANARAFKAGVTLKKILHMARDFRARDSATPLVLMGYYNPVFAYGVEAFLADAKQAGVDGLIIVDTPPEEDAALCDPARAAGLPLIRLVTPTTDDKRLPAVLRNAGGFLYYVSVTGITGGKTADAARVASSIAALRRHTGLPIAAGFGVATPAQAAAMAPAADAVVIGSAIVNRIAANLNDNGAANPGLVEDVLGFVGSLAGAVHRVKS